MEKLNPQPIVNVANYCGISLLNNGMTVTPLKLQKILYYIQAWMLVFFKMQKIFEEIPEAWVNGPVYPSVYARFKAIGMYTQLSEKDFNGNMDLSITSEQKRVLDKLILIYGSKTQDQLVFMTHCEDPWSNARKDLQPFESSHNPISFEDMYSYYKNRYDTNRKNR